MGKIKIQHYLADMALGFESQWYMIRIDLQSEAEIIRHNITVLVLCNCLRSSASVTTTRIQRNTQQVIWLNFMDCLVCSSLEGISQLDTYVLCQKVVVAIYDIFDYLGSHMHDERSYIVTHFDASFKKHQIVLIYKILKFIQL